MTEVICRESLHSSGYWLAYWYTQHSVCFCSEAGMRAGARLRGRDYLSPCFKNRTEWDKTGQDRGVKQVCANRTKPDWGGQTATFDWLKENWPTLSSVLSITTMKRICQNSMKWQRRDKNKLNSSILLAASLIQRKNESIFTQQWSVHFKPISRMMNGCLCLVFVTLIWQGKSPRCQLQLWCNSPCPISDATVLILMLAARKAQDTAPPPNRRTVCVCLCKGVWKRLERL